MMKTVSAVLGALLIIALCSPSMTFAKNDPFVTADWQSIIAEIPGEALDFETTYGKRPTLSGMPIEMTRLQEATVNAKRIAIVPLASGGNAGDTAGLVFGLDDESKVKYIGKIETGAPYFFRGQLVSIAKHSTPGECGACTSHFDVVQYTVKNDHLVTSGPARIEPAAALQGLFMERYQSEGIYHLYIFHVNAPGSNKIQADDYVIQITTVQQELTGYGILGKDDAGQTIFAHLDFSAKPLARVAQRIRLQRIVTSLAAGTTVYAYQVASDNISDMKALKRSTLESTLKLVSPILARSVHKFMVTKIDGHVVEIGATRPNNSQSEFSGTVVIDGGYLLTINAAFNGEYEYDTFSISQLGEPRNRSFRGFLVDKQLTEDVLGAFYESSVIADFKHSKIHYSKLDRNEMQIVEGRVHSFTFTHQHGISDEMTVGNDPGYFNYMQQGNGFTI